MKDDTKKKPSAAKLFKSLAAIFLRYPEQCKVHETSNKHGDLCLEVEPHPEDVRRLIGRGGNMFEAMRWLLLAVARRQGHVRFHYAVKDAGDHARGHELPFATREDWPRQEVLSLFDDALAAVFGDDMDYVTIEDDDRPDGGRGTTLLYAHVRASAPELVPDVAVRDALGRVFAAIGNCCGRKLAVEILRVESLEGSKL